MPLPDDPLARELFDAGARDLAGRYDAELGLVRQSAEGDAWHSPRDTVWHALCLLLTDGDAAEAERALRAVLDVQERRAGDPHRGNFRWFYEDGNVIDLNAVEFIIERLINLLHHAGDRLSDALRAEIDGAMRLGFEEVDRLDVHWTYTNIYLLDVHNSILGGELLDDRALVERGVRRLREWAVRTKADGAPHEFNSATYSAVQINALAGIVQVARSEEARTLALEMEELLWRHVARHFHVPTLQLAGPHSRAYRRDVVGAPDFLKVLLYRLLGEPRLLAPTPYYEGPGQEGSVIVGLTEYHCPPDARELFDRVETREVREHADRAAGMELTTYLTPAFALGSMTRPYGVGDPPEGWPAHNSCILYYAKEREPRYGVLYCRYVVNDRRVGQFVYESSRQALDLWEEGAFRTAQRRGDAIVAYGLLPRGQRPVQSLRLDVRLLGIDGASEVLAGSRRYEGGELALDAPSVVGFADGAVYIGVRVLEPTRLGHGPPVVLWRDGQETVLSVYNYRGPAKQFWEYRSLSGPFYTGNVRNGVVLRVAARADHPSLQSFLEQFAGEPVSDELAGAVRTLAFGDVTLEYDLRELR